MHVGSVFFLNFLNKCVFFVAFFKGVIVVKLHTSSPYNCIIFFHIPYQECIIQRERGVSH